MTSAIAGDRPNTPLAATRIDRARIGAVVRERRISLRIPLRVLRDRIPSRPALALLSRFERGNSNIRLDVLADWCEALDTDLTTVFREVVETGAGVDPSRTVARAVPARPAQMAVAARREGHKSQSGQGFPLITINIAHLARRTEPALDRIRGMLLIYANSRADDHDDFAVDQNLVQVLAGAAGLDAFECWQMLARSIIHSRPVETPVPV